LEQNNCNKSIELDNLLASCQQAVHNWEQAVRTHPVDKLLEQYCYKSAAGLLQLVRFYVCPFSIQARGWLIITMKDNKTIEIVFLKNESRTMIIFVSERQSQNMIILGRSLPSGKCD
jgi:hypothetical protein